MADDNPFGSIGGLMRGIYGPSEAERMQASQQRAAAASAGATSAREQKARAELGQAWDEAVQTSNGDPNVAIKTFIQNPKFFASPFAKDLPTMMKTINEVMNPKPVELPEGGLLATPQGKPLLSNPKVHSLAPGAGAFVMNPAEAGKPPSGTILATQPDKEQDLKAQAQHGATLMQKVYEDSQQATLDQPRFTQLLDIVKRNPGGVSTWLKGYLADKGIPVAGKTDQDLWTAMINQAAPRTREPGSGVFTDKDFDAAVRGLPNKLKSKDANVQIAEQALAMINYRIARGEHAAGYLAGDLTRKQAFEGIKSIKYGAKASPANDPLGLLQ